MGDQEFTAASNTKKNSVVVKVGMVGDSQIGKTSLMVKYVEGTFDEDYIQTLGMRICTFWISFGIFYPPMYYCFSDELTTAI
jgi:GTPase SAR1 family protein